MPSLAQAKRQVTIDALARAAQMLMMERGLDFTMDDVAAAAEVSRSTVFRHFATREDLIITAARIGREEFDARLPVLRSGDWRPWLHELCLVVHQMNSLASRTLPLAVGAEAVSDRLRSIGHDLDQHRRDRYPEIATTLWHAADRDGEPPADLVVVIAAHLSPFFTAAVRHEAGADHRAAARMAEQAITGAVSVS